MRRRLIIIIAAVLALSIPALIAVFVVDRNPGLQNSVLRLTNTQANTNLTNLAVTNTVTNTATNPDRAQITYVARNFSETYASGTNQNNFAHYQQAKQWGTADFNRFLDRLIRQEESTPTTPFHGTVSTALVITISRQTPAAASVSVALQRVETLENTTKSYTQELYVDLIKQGSDWKVNAAAWQVL